MNKDIKKKLEQRKIRPTPMRILVYDILAKNKKALSLAEIEAQFDNVDRSTIFRTLKTFQDKLLIHSVEDGSGAVKYAVCEDDCTCSIGDLHVHFLCTKCGQTYCLNEISIPEIKLPEGFSLQSANYVLKGICPKCSRS